MYHPVHKGDTMLRGEVKSDSLSQELKPWLTWKLGPHFLNVFEELSCGLIIGVYCKYIRVDQVCTSEPFLVYISIR
jgi:hypothetical protein